MEGLSDAALQGKTTEFRGRLERGEDLDDVLMEAFAVVREAGRRVLGQRHYDVQLIGGAALHFGWIAEMKTGEGKTLVSTLPAYLNGLGGYGTHLITVNEYLARRDSEWMGRLHRWLGLEVGLIVPGENDPEHKRQQYAADITYGTNNEFGFDYLRDNMAMSRSRQTQRGHSYAIVDEVDSILIDEARTPLDHLGSGRRRGAAVLQVRHHRPQPAPRRRLRRRRAEAHGVAHGGGHREGRGVARDRQPLRRRRPEPRAPAPGRPARQGAVQAGQGLHHQQRRGEDRRRVHRPHPRGSALVGGPPPGRGGQGGREDQGGEPDPRHDHAPELLPHVREARRHDGHRVHGGGRVRQHLRPPGRAGADEQAHGARGRGRPDLQDRGRQVRRRGRRHRRALRGRSAGPRRHDLGGEVREAVADAREAGHRP